MLLKKLHELKGDEILARDIKDEQNILFYNFETNSVEEGTVIKVTLGN